MFEKTQSGDLNQIVNESIGTLNNVDQRIRALRAQLGTVAPYVGQQVGAPQPPMAPTPTPTPVAPPQSIPGVPFAQALPEAGMAPQFQNFGQAPPVTPFHTPFYGVNPGVFGAPVGGAGVPTPSFHVRPTAIPAPGVPYVAPTFNAIPGPGIPTTPYVGGEDPRFQGQVVAGAPSAYGAPSLTGFPSMDPNTSTTAPGGGKFNVRGQLPVTGGAGIESNWQQPGQRLGNVRQPPVDVFDEGKELVFQFELPGVKKDNLELTAMDRAIALRAKSVTEHGDEGALMRERGPVEYVRQIPLPVEISTSKTKAKFEDGVLTVKVPKKNPTEGPQRISIS